MLGRHLPSLCTFALRNRKTEALGYGTKLPLHMGLIACSKYGGQINCEVAFLDFLCANMLE